MITTIHLNGIQTGKTTLILAFLGHLHLLGCKVVYVVDTAEDRHWVRKMRKPPEQLLIATVNEFIELRGDYRAIGLDVSHENLLFCTKDGSNLEEHAINRLAALYGARQLLIAHN